MTSKDVDVPEDMVVKEERTVASWILVRSHLEADQAADVNVSDI
jgi:hypothetical protein